MLRHEIRRNYQYSFKIAWPCINISRRREVGLTILQGAATYFEKEYNNKGSFDTKVSRYPQK